ncbi:hypothetical protein LINPERHAP1_LOCUS30548 [Linum perenne]
MLGNAQISSFIMGMSAVAQNMKKFVVQAVLVLLLLFAVMQSTEARHLLQSGIGCAPPPRHVEPPYLPRPSVSPPGQKG